MFARGRPPVKTVHTEAEEAMLPLLNNTLVHGIDSIEESAMDQPRKFD